MSPEDMRNKLGHATQGPLRSNQPPAFLLGSVPIKENTKGKAPDPASAGYQDPFVTPKPGPTAAGAAELPKLSPVAPTFTPLGFVEKNSEGIMSRTLQVPGAPSTGVAMCTPGSLPSASLMPETPYGEAVLERYLSSVTTGTHLSWSSQTSSSSIHSPGAMRQPTKSGHFSSDGPISRSMMISQIDVRTPSTDLEGLISVSLPEIDFAKTECW